MIRKSEGQEAKIELIHPDITIFNLDWIRLEVLRDKIIFKLLQNGHEEAMADLIINTFKLLRHTPMEQMGINKEVVFSVESEQAWHAAGDTLAPKDIWTPIVNNPGMNSLTMQSSRETDTYKGFIRTTIRPDQKQEYGINISINDHYEIGTKEDIVKNSDNIISIFEKEWKKSLENSSKIIKSLMERL